MNFAELSNTPVRDSVWSAGRSDRARESILQSPIGYATRHALAAAVYGFLPIVWDVIRAQEFTHEFS